MTSKSKKIKIITLGLTITIVCIGVIGYYLWNMPHIDVQNEKVDFELNSSELVNEYLKNEKIANQKYLGDDGNSKILLVNGTVSEISEDMNHQTIVLLKSQSDKAGVKCVFLPESKDHTKSIALGSNVAVKGIIRVGASYDPDLEIYENVLLEKCDLATAPNCGHACSKEN